MSPLIDIVSLALSAAETLAPEEVAIQLKAYGLAVDELSAAAGQNPEAAVAGVLVGFGLVAATAPITATTVGSLVVASGLSGAAAAAFEVGATVALEYGIAKSASALTEDSINALASVLNTQATISSITQSFSAYGQGELYNAQVELDSSAAMWSATGQALSSAGESLYSDVQSIGNYFSGLFSVSQNANGTETLDVTNQNSSNNWTNSLLNITASGSVSFGLINYTNGTSQSDYYNPDSGISSADYSFSAPDATGTLTTEMVNFTNGTSQNWLYNPYPNETNEVWFYAGSDGSGQLEQIWYNYTNGTSQVALFGALPATLVADGITSEISTFQNANGTGATLSWVYNYSDGQSTINYPGTGSLQEQTFVYSGPSGTGTNTGIINYNTNGTSTWYNLAPSASLTSAGVTEVIAQYSGDSPIAADTQFAIFNYASGKSHLQEYNPSSGVSELIANYNSLNASGTATDTTLWWSSGGSQVQINGAAHNLGGVSTVMENWSGQYGGGNNGQETSAQINFSNGWIYSYTYQYANGGTTPTQITQTLQAPSGVDLQGNTFGPGPSYTPISGSGNYGYDGGGIAVMGINEASFGGYGLAAGAGSKSAGIDVIAQYDQSHGFAAAAADAEAARIQASQLLAEAGVSPGAQTLSPFEGAKWSDRIITWSFATSAGTSAAPFSGAIPPQYQAVIEQAVQAWAKASGLTFAQVPDSSASDIRIGWGSFDTASSNVIGFTSGQMIGGQLQPGVIIRLEDPGQTSIVGAASIYSGTGVGLYQDALHEIGHALGLADNADPNSIMFAALGAGNRTLDATDLANIATLYGPAASPVQGTAGILAQGGSAPAGAAPALAGPLPAPPLTYPPTLTATLLH